MGINILHATETGWMGHLAGEQTLPTYPYIYFLIDISLPPPSPPGYPSLTLVRTAGPHYILHHSPFHHQV